jgi:7-carboxy-7-deazaguanine synthase
MNICEIFYSIQGESTYSGLPCVFVRTSGCNLRCLYCDTKYAYKNDADMSIDAIKALVSSYNCRLVEITGGEPLIQNEEVNKLISVLLDNGHEILLETNGSISIESVNPKVIKIMDLKCPDSGMSEHIHWDNLKYLCDHDQVKFVISSRKDYDWAKDIIINQLSQKKLEVLISTVFGLLKPSEAVNWILEDHLKVRFQLQIHKYIWHPATKGV